MHIDMYVHINKRRHMHINKRIHMHMQMCIYYMYIHSCIHTYIHKHIITKNNPGRVSSSELTSPGIFDQSRVSESRVSESRICESERFDDDVTTFRVAAGQIIQGAVVYMHARMHACMHMDRCMVVR
jgi:hypothetical protein